MVACDTSGGLSRCDRWGAAGLQIRTCNKEPCNSERGHLQAHCWGKDCQPGYQQFTSSQQALLVAVFAQCAFAPCIMGL